MGKEYNSNLEGGNSSPPFQKGSSCLKKDKFLLNLNRKGGDFNPL